MIVTARLKGRNDAAIITAWFGAALVYGKSKLPSLESLIDPPTKADKKRALIAMFEEMKERTDHADLQDQRVRQTREGASGLAESD